MSRSTQGHHQNIIGQKSSKLFTKSYEFAFSHVWRRRVKGQGQPKVIIWTTLILLEYPMLHTNYQCHRLIGSGEEFESILTIFGHKGPACHVTPTVWANICSFSPRRLNKIWPSGFWDSRCLKLSHFNSPSVKGQIMTLTFWYYNESANSHLISQL